MHTFINTKKQTNPTIENLSYRGVGNRCKVSFNKRLASSSKLFFAGGVTCTTDRKPTGPEGDEAQMSSALAIVPVASQHSDPDSAGVDVLDDFWGELEEAENLLDFKHGSFLLLHTHLPKDCVFLIRVSRDLLRPGRHQPALLEVGFTSDEEVIECTTYI
jgi:hypothetical protein